MNRMIVIFLFCVAMSAPSMVFSESDLERLDPHGSKDLNLKLTVFSEHPECKVCHRMKEEKMVLNPHIPRRCELCHNPFPHSGVIEHKGRALCIDCHRPHRAILLDKAALREPPSIPSFHIDKPEPMLPEGLVMKKNPDPMLRKNCRECHPWK